MDNSLSDDFYQRHPEVPGPSSGAVMSCHTPRPISKLSFGAV
ncbi:hypothetical protein L3Q82_019281, partial [Scortum barcoo]